MITGLLLAAGAGSRFGGAKLLATLPAASHGVPAGTPVGVASCLHLVAAVPHVVAVVRPGDVALATALRDAGAAVVECGRAHEGMGASLACGVRATPEADGWIVALADMPLIAPATIAAVAQALASGGGVVVPRHADRRGHPVGFARGHRNALLALTGDAGARSVVAAAGAAVALLDVDDPGILSDIDVAADLVRLGA